MTYLNILRIMHSAHMESVWRRNKVYTLIYILQDTNIYIVDKELYIMRCINMTNNETKLINQANDFTTEKLVEIWEETEKIKMTEELVIVRGTIMDVLESRNKVNFDAWIESDDINAKASDFFKVDETNAHTRTQYNETKDLMRATAMCLPFDEDLIRGARK
jgi:hypothetical protein